MINQKAIYNNGKPIIPQDGRYKVEMYIKGERVTVLEKKIKQGVGTNHLPCFFLRRFAIPNMSFVINLVGDEVLFTYDNGIITDTLKYISSGCWIGKIYYKGEMIEWFRLVSIS